MENKDLKIVWIGNCFNETGIARANRKYVETLINKFNVKVRTRDLFRSKNGRYDKYKIFNEPMDVDGAVTVAFEYPHRVHDVYGKAFLGFTHEGTKLFPDWVSILNQADVVWCPSNAVKRMFKYNGVLRKIYVIPHGVDFDLYHPRESPKDENEPFTFLSINSWTGYENDRKGTDLLIKAFYEEFKDNPNVRLLLKISSFWDNKPQSFYLTAVSAMINGAKPMNISVNSEELEEEKIAELMREADVFVAPTRGEGFGLTILESLASGVPVIVTSDVNSGHMDFCMGNPAVFFIDIDGLVKGDTRFFVEGSMFANPSLESLKKQMRYVYENRKILRELGKEGRKFVSNFTWENASKKILEMINEEVKNGEDT